jgi:hypothetical protein
MLLAGGDLLVVEVQFSFVGPLHPHAGASFRFPQSGGRGGERESLTLWLLEQVYHLHQRWSRGRERYIWARVAIILSIQL